MNTTEVPIFCNSVNRGTHKGRYNIIYIKVRITNSFEENSEEYNLDKFDMKWKIKYRTEIYKTAVFICTPLQRRPWFSCLLLRRQYIT